MKRIVQSYLPILPITAVFGLVFGIVSNIFFDRLIAAVWPPLAITALFFCFLVPLLLIIYIVAESKGARTKMERFVPTVLLTAVAFLVAVFGFEALYELGLKTTAKSVDSYVIILDDSGSMEANDPSQVRLSSVDKLLQDKTSDFKYSVYSFADSYTQIRPLLPKSQSTPLPDMESTGGTSIYSTMSGIMDDIKSGKLNATENTRFLLLSDGVATDTSATDGSLRRLLREYASRGFVISTIGLGRGVDVRLMEMLSRSTGGAYIQADDVSQLTNAMVEASFQMTNRTLLSLRFFCKTETLHAIIRIVFLLVIALILQSLKIEVYGKYYKPNLILGAVCSVAAAVFAEVAIEHTGLSESFCRIVIWVLLALTMLEQAIRVRECADDDDNSSSADPKSLDPSCSVLDKTNGDNDKGIDQLI